MARDLYVKARLQGGTITAPAVLSGPLRTQARLGQTVVEYVGESNPYTGDYEVTPGPSPVTLSTRHKFMSENVIINPIPSNYGLVTWDGAVLTVS